MDASACSVSQTGSISQRAGFITIRVVSAKTITAVDSASAAHHQECPALVFMQNSGGLTDVQISNRIGTKAGNGLVFEINGQDLFQEWVIGIAWLDAV